MSEVVTENKMGIMPIGKLLFSMSVPMIMSMMVQALYNIVDSIFVAMINEEALTAVSLAFPLQNLMIAIGVGTGVGVNALVSRHLGEKNFERANSVATHGVRLAVFSSVFFAFFTLIVVKPFFAAQADDPVIVGYGINYMRICGVFCIGIYFQTMYEKILQSTGKSVFAMVVQMTGAILNIILDPILIFGVGPFPKMGVVGAAVATVTGQLISAVLAIFINKKFNPELNLSFSIYPLSGRIVKSIYSIGVPSIIMASIGSIMVFGFNKILMGFSATATAVFGVYFKLQSFALMPVFGLNNGMVPIVAYNYGAAKPDRIKKTIRLSILVAESIMAVCFTIMQVFPVPLLHLFSASDYMISIGVPALRIISAHFLLAGYSIILSSTFQALGHGFISMFGSIMRQLVVLLPAAFVLSLLGGLNAVWWSFLIAEAVVVVFNTIMIKRLFRQIITPLYRRRLRTF